MSLRLRMTWRLEVLCLLVLGYVGELATEDTQGQRNILTNKSLIPPLIRDSHLQHFPTYNSIFRVSSESRFGDLEPPRRVKDF